MNHKIIAFGTGLFLASSAYAVSPDVRSFPPLMAETPEAVAVNQAGMQRAPLNPNKDMGTKLFGYTINGFDFDGPCHYLDFYNTNTLRLNKLSSVVLPGASRYDDDNPRMLGPVSGAWCGDSYYAWRLVYYSLGITRLYNWVSVDPETGSSQLHTDTNAKNPSWWSMPQALLWNPNKPDELHAMIQNTDGSISSLYVVVDKATGEMKDRLYAFPEYYMAAVYNYDNQICAIRWDYDEEGIRTGTVLDVIDPEDDFNVISSTPILVDGKPWLVYYQNNMTIDYTTGDIWWSAWNDKAQNRLVKIDPLTFATENFGSYGVSEGVDGLYVAYDVAESRNAPARVENLNFAIDPQGNNNTTLSWTNPSTRWNRRSLTNLTSVQIYRDSYEGTPVGTLDATGKEGQAMTWTDTNAPAGIHKYYVVPVNASGKGVPRNIDAFVGKDVPGPVTGLKAETTDGKTIQLSWNLPQRGDNDGWFDSSDLSYTITRLPDGKTFDPVKATSFTDNTIDEAQLFSYSVVASNAQGSGSAVVSNGVLAGTGIRPPFSTKFETAVDAARFTAIDKNGDGRCFEYGNNNHILRETMRMDISNGTNDDVLVSPTLLLEKGKTYKVDFRLYFGGYGSGNRVSSHPCRIIGGTAATAEAMTDVHVDDPDFEVTFPTDGVTYTKYFKSPVDGEYYIGYELMTANEEYMWVYVEGFSIEEAPSNDLQAVAVKAHQYLSAIENNTFNIEIYNNGENAQSDYTVKLAYLDDKNEPQVFAQTDIVPEIEAHATDYVEIEAIMPVVGYQRVVAIVDLESDGNPANNMSAPLSVMSDEAPALNFTIDDVANPATSTNLPLNHYYAYTAAQTIYTPAMTLFDRIFEGKTPSISRVAWEYTSLSDFVPFESTEIAVYLSQTDRTGYPDEAPSFLPVTGEALFNSAVPFQPGHNYMVADLDEEFTFDPAKSLVVTITKADTEHSAFLVNWRSFDANWHAKEYHSIRYQGNSAFDVANPIAGSSFADAPMIHLAIAGDNAGIEEVVLTGKGAVYYNAATSSVEAVDYDMTSVEVYDLSGKLVKKVAVAEGATSAHIACGNGVYLLKVNGADGSALTLKAKI
ncbi:MAG: T9SS type A sorting domain-containing protein [Muribaculaceae bacterium]|nr:T9SS type A sorting domain-containing protein [Muribaculaceae bacterium]